MHLGARSIWQRDVAQIIDRNTRDPRFAAKSFASCTISLVSEYRDYPDGESEGGCQQRQPCRIEQRKVDGHRCADNNAVRSAAKDGSSDST